MVRSDRELTMHEEPTPFDASQEPDPGIRWRAWRMWLAAGRPNGEEDEYLHRARELQAADDRPAARPLPKVVHVVDDDDGVRDSLQTLLEASGYRALAYASGAELLRALPGLEQGCIVADLRMPDIDGLKLLHELRARNAKLPYILVTGHGDVPMAVQAMKAGAADFIQKPFARELILKSIRHALGQATAG
jgi:CheY-like chemotaxis protein